MPPLRKQPPPYFFLLFITLLLTYGAIWTAWPGPASKPNPLGYYSQCPWAPFSSLIMSAAAGIVCSVRKRAYRVQDETADDTCEEKNSTIG